MSEVLVTMVRLRLRITNLMMHWERRECVCEIEGSLIKPILRLPMTISFKQKRITTKNVKMGR